MALLGAVPLGVGAGFIVGYGWIRWEEQVREREDRKNETAEDEGAP